MVELNIKILVIIIIIVVIIGFVILTRSNKMVDLGVFTGTVEDTEIVAGESGTSENFEVATLAGGCFWCMESDFKKLPGVKEVFSGYSGGDEKDPTYGEVSAGKTGHKEVIQVTYNPSEISYEKIIENFWKNIDPLDDKGQFCDKGPQYLAAIFYHDSRQKVVADKSKKLAQDLFEEPIVTEILKYEKFYKAEEYHQDYHTKNPIRYNAYRSLCGRDGTLNTRWKDKKIMLVSNNPDFSKPSDAELKKILTPIQYKVTQKDGTERSFNNEYWDNKKDGIYVDVVSGEPLFSSLDKFKSGTGWPSFTKPLEPDNIIELEDNSFFMKRIELRSKNADSHLGHIFNDGPKPSGLRYCMNSAALRFVAKEDLEKEGYNKYSYLFE